MTVKTGMPNSVVYNSTTKNGAWELTILSRGALQTTVLGKIWLESYLGRTMANVRR